MIPLSKLDKLNEKSALEKFIKTRYKSDPAEFVEDISASVNDLLRSDLKQAGEYVARLDEIFGYLPDRFKQRLLAIKGRYNHWNGVPRKALKYYLQARELHQKAGEREAVARLGKGLLDVYRFLGDYKKALQVAKSSLRYFRKAGLAVDAADVMNNMGNIYHRMDNNRMSLQYYDKAREIYLGVGGVRMAVIEFNRANIFANMNKLEKAEELWRKAAKFYSNLGMAIGENQAVYSIAYLYFLQDRYTEAIKLFEQVYDRFKDLGDEKTATVTLLDMAEIDIYLNQFSSAVMLADQIIPKFKKLGMRYEQSKACYFAADARIRLGDFQSAGHMLRKARNLFEKQNNNLWLGMVNIANGKLNMARGQYGRASRAATRAIELFRKSGDLRRRNDAELDLMRASVLAGDTKNAFRIFRSLSSKNLVSYQRYNLNYYMGQCYYRLGDFSHALDKFRRAVIIVEKMLSGLYPDELRFFFAMDKHNCYKMVVECLLKLELIDDSFHANLRALQSINYSANYKLRQHKSITGELLEQRNNLRAALKKMNQVKHAEQRHLEKSGSYLSLEQKLWSNERKIRSILYPSEVRRQGSEADLRNLKKSLESDEVILNYFSSGPTVGAFMADRERTKYIEFDISSSELEYYLQKLHFIFESAVFG
ncbi:MAG: tetratricopeptide repeat protein, partial [candidate division Zixibacteria bacterium]|nr:tetratricopeptide repeat protein [candidate division Zixibacteria bacterium]NIR68142.1 tetratricopeptide repeat protein [candidate division Zixibacteria bacterium]NIS17818.1 tetratricopeptide repeat protein [candidate division Zixibacteria bacterium]NIS49357.1 tetratricopeptide repeat protein [candidate division Zixibacteria bacterium]NIT54136.1 tetratricopeptide repeat protein [candidate division Zixibacteria bacterium]